MNELNGLSDCPLVIMKRTPETGERAVMLIGIQRGATQRNGAQTAEHLFSLIFHEGRWQQNLNDTAHYNAQLVARLNTEAAAKGQRIGLLTLIHNAVELAKKTYPKG